MAPFLISLQLLGALFLLNRHKFKKMSTKFRPKLVFLFILFYLLANNLSHSLHLDNSSEEKETTSLLPKGREEIGEIKEEKKDQEMTVKFLLPENPENTTFGNMRDNIFKLFKTKKKKNVKNPHKLSKNRTEKIKFEHINAQIFANFEGYLNKQKDEEKNKKLKLVKKSVKNLEEFEFITFLKIREICGDLENYFREHIGIARDICLINKFTEKFDKMLGSAKTKFEKENTLIDEGSEFNKIIYSKPSDKKHQTAIEKLKDVVRRLTTGLTKKLLNGSKEKHSKMSSNEEEKIYLLGGAN
uniref:Uncharacterized protein n=1 Tax=Meloidogyne enterolobii TaxID=390850 RepID=A0A6V7VV90_MELEN|nr:unnamed protein product [Meloidogyne enterolobii]